MSKRSGRDSRELNSLYGQFLGKQSEEWRSQFASVCRERDRNLAALGRRRVRTVADLVDQLPSLPLRFKELGIELVSLFKIREAAPVLLKLTEDPEMRLACSGVLESLGPDRLVTPYFLKIGRRELASPTPDDSWLAAVIYGLGHSSRREATELLVEIYERRDLPGRLRGDAADKLGCDGFISDRRTTLHRRCLRTSLEGLADESIDVQFWSMYLIGSMCTFPRGRNRDDFVRVLPKLKQIAKTDTRMCPGYWWPMSAEAEDVIACIRFGGWPEPDAAERWSKTSGRTATC